MAMIFKIGVMVMTILILSLWPRYLYGEGKVWEFFPSWWKRFVVSHKAYWTCMMTLILFTGASLFYDEVRIDEIEAAHKKQTDSLHYALNILPDRILHDPKFDSLRNEIVELKGYGNPQLTQTSKLQIFQKVDSILVANELSCIAVMLRYPTNASEFATQLLDSLKTNGYHASYYGEEHSMPLNGVEYSIEGDCLLIELGIL